MKMLLTGGAGDLARVLSTRADFVNPDDEVILLDVREPSFPLPRNFHFTRASIEDISSTRSAISGSDCVIHIAAWHGIHEFTKQKSVFDFHNLNITGTFHVLQSCAEAAVNNFIFISSTSINDPYSIYGHTKIVGEEMTRAYSARHNIKSLILRPRAFIPHWNRAVYPDFLAWLAWFWKGAVHISDVAQSVAKSLHHLRTTSDTTTILGADLSSARQASSDVLSARATTSGIVPALTVDGAYDLPDAELANWSRETFAQHYPEFAELAAKHSLDTGIKPKKLDVSETQSTIGYSAQYSLRSALSELAKYGTEGPPPP